MSLAQAAIAEMGSPAPDAAGEVQRMIFLADHYLRNGNILSVNCDKCREAGNLPYYLWSCRACFRDNPIPHDFFFCSISKMRDMISTYLCGRNVMILYV